MCERENQANGFKWENEVSAVVSFVDHYQIQNRIQVLHLALTAELSKAWVVFKYQPIQRLPIGLAE